MKAFTFLYFFFVRAIPQTQDIFKVQFLASPKSPKIYFIPCSPRARLAIPALPGIKWIAWEQNPYKIG